MLSMQIGAVPFSPIASGLLSGKVTAETKFEGDDVRKFIPQLSKENLGAWNVELTKEEFSELEAALDACTVYGHRGHVESEQNSFGNHWKK